MPRRDAVALVAGFAPFGGGARNPSGDAARALDGLRLGRTRIVGRVLPVALAGLDRAIRRLLANHRPRVAIGLGLAEGEAAIRLERWAFNLADFRIADNAGARPRDRKLDPAGPDLLRTRLPLRAVERAILARGIPARLSSTPGEFVCNAFMYRLLALAPASLPCGFVHVPQSSEAAAAALAAGLGSAATPTLPLASLCEAVLAALATSLREAAEPPA